MQDQNVAYTEEYQEYRKTFEHVFDDKYSRDDNEERQIGDGEYKLVTSFFYDDSHEFYEYNLYASKTEVLDSGMNKLYEIKNINHSTNFFSTVKHSNGKNYLLFSIDLYGYSIMDLSNYDVFHYIPEKSFRGKEESFIWTNALYCKENNYLAVDGCYWACPSSTQVFDFSKPESLPYKLVFDSCEMKDETNIGHDVVPHHWNEDGSLVIQCSNGEKDFEKTIQL